MINCIINCGIQLYDQLRGQLWGQLRDQLEEDKGIPRFKMKISGVDVKELVGKWTNKLARIWRNW